jgi:glutathione synthase/RimK-type ligase-like ATP-grasp enzyme
MLFILTNSQDATVSHLTPALEKAKIPFLRLDTDNLTSRISISYDLTKAAIEIFGQWYQAQDVGAVWYRRPEKLKDDRFDDSPESQYALEEWTEFIECFFAHVPKARWMNHPSYNTIASRKLEQLTTAVTIGFSVPDTLATQDSDKLREFFEHHQGQVIVKPLSSGYVDRAGKEKDSLIYTNRVTASHLDDLSDLSLCPALFQQFIQKAYDVRITVVDADIHSVKLVATDESGGQRCDIRRNNMSDVAYEAVSLPMDIESKIRKLTSHYSLRFAAIDMAVSKSGEWYFFEVNPNGQWAWLDMTAGTNISASLVKSLSGTVPG